MIVLAAAWSGGCEAIVGFSARALGSDMADASVSTNVGKDDVDAYIDEEERDTRNDAAATDATTNLEDVEHFDSVSNNAPDDGDLSDALARDADVVRTDTGSNDANVVHADSDSNDSLIDNDSYFEASEFGDVTTSDADGAVSDAVGPDAKASSSEGGDSSGVILDPDLPCLQQPTYIYCNDFDETSAVDQTWDWQSTNFASYGAMFLFDTTDFLSSPQSLKALIPSDTGSTDGVLQLGKNLGSLSDHLRFAFDFRLDLNSMVGLP